MTLAARIEGDLRIAGDLTVDGAMPTISRTSLVQDPNIAFAVPMTSLRVWDAIATNLPGAAANDDLGLDGGTWATNSPCITTGDVKAASSTRYARFQVALPAEYDAGQTVTLRFHAGMKTTVADTSCTLDLVAYKSDQEAGIGADLCATAAQSINSLTDADYDFVITPTGLTAGDVLDCRIAVAYVDAATGTAVIAQIGAIELLCDIKG
jgi:hypothetical protein